MLWISARPQERTFSQPYPAWGPIWRLWDNRGVYYHCRAVTSLGLHSKHPCHSRPSIFPAGRNFSLFFFLEEISPPTPAPCPMLFHRVPSSHLGIQSPSLLSISECNSHNIYSRSRPELHLQTEEYILGNRRAYPAHSLNTDTGESRTPPAHSSFLQADFTAACSSAATRVTVFDKADPLYFSPLS